jgi:hypothetical protein
MPLQATSGAASYDAFGGGVPVGPATYIEDVFSTYLYTGTNAAQTITNGIDLSTKGGLVWFKNRSALTGAYAGFDRHVLFDNIRTGATNGGAGGGGVLRTNAAALDDATVTYLSSYNNNGVTIASNATVSNAEFINQSGTTFASWTWRKQPKYFDIQTWTGSGSNRTISHSLGSVPACIFVKRTDATGDWQVYHRSLANTEYLVLNSTAAKATGATRWNSTTPTSTEFSLGTDATVNASAGTYVAYIFAHDAGGFGLAGTDNVISCGSFATDGSGNFTTQNIGYEPQWLMIKSSTSVDPWIILDNMRGLNLTRYVQLFANSSAAENSGNAAYIFPTATGFGGANNNLDASATYIYIAIRRGPMKVPTLGTTVFQPITASSSSTIETTTATFPLDMQFNTFTNSSSATYNNQINDRLRGIGFSPSFNATPHLTTASTAAETTADSYLAFKGNGMDVTKSDGWGAATAVFYNFRRAPSFFDEVCWTATGSTQTLNHNLAVVPEIIITKKRIDNTGSGAAGWIVMSSAYTGGFISGGLTSFGQLQSSDAVNIGAGGFLQSIPTSTTFTLLASNYAATDSFVAYLFATCAGVSKVGSYTGNGTTQTIDCGFGAGGARFVLIKRTDSTGDWYVYDTARGMTVLTDPYLWLNSTAAEVATLGSVTTVSTGFAVNASVLAAINTNAASYIFLAIA